MSEEEKALLEKFEKEVRKDLANHTVDEVLTALESELWQLEATSLYATTGGMLGAPNYEKVSMLIRVVKQVIEKVKNGEIKPPPHLVQTTFDGKQYPPFPFKPRKYGYKPSQYLEGRQTDLDSFIQA